ncbi:MAG: NIPSNAP family protein [Alphaproteobacteria bacterium]|jgi:hypothetical protein
MLYELRKYTLQVGTMATVLDLYGNLGYPAFSAEEKARLVGYFTSDTGTLNQIVHLWRFTDDAERRAHWKGVFSNAAFMDFAKQLRPNILSQENQLLNEAPWGPTP